jgi:hypothetical protein
MLRESEPVSFQEVGNTHREIADLFGIGRARVFFHEREALKKLRRAMERVGIYSPIDFDLIAIRRDGCLAPVGGSPRARKAKPQFSPQHGWLKVTRIVSVNRGSEEVEDVVRAFHFLKQRHESLVRPPVMIKSRNETPYVIQAVAEHHGAMMVRCWPNNHRVRTVAHLQTLRCTAIVESEFDSDREGSFDIPILLCVILS